MSDVFLAYADEDRARAKALHDALVQRGRTVDWERRIPFGQSDDDVVEAQLAAARCVIALWSAHSVKEPMVKAEARDALDHQKLIPVFIEDVAPPLRYRGMPAARLVDWHGEVDSPAFADLDQSISTLLGSAAPAAHLDRPITTGAVDSSPRWKRLVADLSSSEGKTKRVMAVLAVVGTVIAALLKGGALAASAHEWLYRDNAIDRNVSKLGLSDSSPNIVALDSLRLLVRNKPNRALRAYPGVLAFLADRLPHRRTMAGTCSSERPADGRQPHAVALALTFLRENRRGRTADSVDMSGVELSGADLRGADLRRFNFSHACLAQARLDSTTLDGASFARADLRGAVLSGASGRHVIFVNAQLDTATFTAANLPGARFIFTPLYDGRFQGARLESAVFQGAKLARVDFTGAYLKGVAFDSAFGGADVAGARFDDKPRELDANTTSWLRRVGACFVSLAPQTKGPATVIVVSDTACQCAAEPVQACNAHPSVHD